METVEDKVVRHGKALLTNFFILIRITKIYDSMNETILNTASRLLAELEPILTEAGEISIKMVQGSFYIEGIRIKAGVNDVEGFAFLAEEMIKRGIGAFTFVSPVNVEDLIRLAYAIQSEGGAAGTQASLERGLVRNIVISGPVVLTEEDVDLKDSGAMARRAYLRTFSAIKEMDDSIRSGTRLKLKRIKRALQLVVDSISADESHLLLLTNLRSADLYYYCHPVNVSILSVALGKRIGLDRVDLRSLATTALFHDAGKAEIPLSILKKKGEFSTKEMELIKRHPTDGVKILLRSFGLNEASILSMLVSFEHHMKLDLSGYPQTPPARKPNLFSRIVSIADDYDSLVSGMVYGGRKLGSAEVLGNMNRDKGKLYDPVLLKAFSSIFPAGPRE